MPLVKRALIRDPNAPDGVTANLFIRCCEYLLPQPREPFPGAGGFMVVKCPTCGTIYDADGWIVA